MSPNVFVITTIIFCYPQTLIKAYSNNCTDQILQPSTEERRIDSISNEAEKNKRTFRSTQYNANMTTATALLGTAKKYSLDASLFASPC